MHSTWGLFCPCLGRFVVTIPQDLWSHSPPTTSPSNSAVALLLTTSQNFLHPSALAHPPLLADPLYVVSWVSPLAFWVASFIVVMLMVLRWVFKSPPAASEALLYLSLLEPGIWAIQVNCPMNEGCTGECEEKENSCCPFHSCILQIFIEYLLSAGVLQEKLGTMVSWTRLNSVLEGRETLIK